MVRCVIQARTLFVSVMEHKLTNVPKTGAELLTKWTSREINHNRNTTSKSMWFAQHLYCVNSVECSLEASPFLYIVMCRATTSLFYWWQCLALTFLQMVPYVTFFSRRWSRHLLPAQCAAQACLDVLRCFIYLIDCGLTPGIMLSRYFELSYTCHNGCRDFIASRYVA